MESEKKVKQVIVVRKDLNMRKGKMVAQGGHASISNLVHKFRKLKYVITEVLTAQCIIAIIIGGVFLGGNASLAVVSICLAVMILGPIICFAVLYYTAKLDDAEDAWYYGPFRKICLGCADEKELLDIFEKAKAEGLRVHLIEDRGLTEFKGVLTKTCLAIGPHFDEDIDKITGHLTPL